MWAARGIPSASRSEPVARTEPGTPDRAGSAGRRSPRRRRQHVLESCLAACKRDMRTCRWRSSSDLDDVDAAEHFRDSRYTGHDLVPGISAKRNHPAFDRGSDDLQVACLADDLPLELVGHREHLEDAEAVVVPGPVASAAALPVVER